MEPPFSPLMVAEYFAGIGLVRMGLQPFGWQVDFANDIMKNMDTVLRAILNVLDDE